MLGAWESKGAWLQHMQFLLRGAFEECRSQELVDTAQITVKNKCFLKGACGGAQTG